MHYINILLNSHVLIIYKLENTINSYYMVLSKLCEI